MKFTSILISVSLILQLVQNGPVTNTTDFWSRQLGKNTSYDSYAGYQQLEWYYPKGQTGIYYSAFSAFGTSLTQTNPDIPVLIWLQGGPGGSSQFGSFTQIGPIQITKGQAGQRQYPWNLMGHLIFIDSPLNVGFSYFGDRNGTKQISTTNEASNHLMNFIYNFFSTWRNLKNNPLYITGQSYAGHYIPSLARKLLLNKTLVYTVPKLVAISLGDGWTDPINQLNFYDQYLYSVGIIDETIKNNFTNVQASAIVSITAGDYKKATETISYITDDDQTADVILGNVSFYNFKHYTDPDETFSSFLEANKLSLGVPANITFIQSNENIYKAFGPDITLSFKNDLIEVLKQIRVLIYNGQYDIIVNTPGVLQYLNELNWDKINEWKSAPKKLFIIEDEIVGWTKVGNNLWFTLVNFAGHLIPTDQPRTAFSMLGRFINNINNQEIKELII